MKKILACLICVFLFTGCAGDAEKDHDTEASDTVNSLEESTDSFGLLDGDGEGTGALDSGESEVGTDLSSADSEAETGGESNGGTEGGTEIEIENEIEKEIENGTETGSEMDKVTGSEAGKESEAGVESPGPTGRPRYELTPITEARYENGDSYIEFNDLPENDAETVACYDLLFQIVSRAQWKKMEIFYYARGYFEDDFDDGDSDDDSGDDDSNDDSDDDGESYECYEWIKVERVDTMSFEDLKQDEYYEDLFENLVGKLAPDMEMDEYVQMILSNGCAVVLLKFEDKYTEEYNQRLPQWADGEQEIYYLLIPDENGQFRIFSDTTIYLHFNVYIEKPYIEERVPDVLKRYL